MRPPRRPLQSGWEPGTSATVIYEKIGSVWLRPFGLISVQLSRPWQKESAQRQHLAEGGRKECVHRWIAQKNIRNTVNPWGLPLECQRRVFELGMEDPRINVGGVTEHRLQHFDFYIER